MRMSLEEFSGGGQIIRSDGSLTGTPKEEVSPIQTAKEVGIGVLKGLGDTAFSTGNILNEGLKRAPSSGVVVPAFQKLQSYVTDAGMNPFEGDNQERITEELKADNTMQKAGKGVALLGEILFPAGAASRALGLTERASKVLSGVGDDLVEGGVKVKDRLLDVIGNLDEKTKTALDRTPKETFDTFLKQGQEAVADDRVRTPLETVGDSVIDGLKSLKDRASKVGEAKSKLLEQASVGYQKVGNIAQRKALDVQRAFSGLDLDASDTRLIKEFKDAFKSLGENPRLKDVDAKIDYLQDKIYKSGIDTVAPTTDRVTGILRRELSDLNNQIQELAGESYRDLNVSYREMIEISQEINMRLGKEGASAGSFVKRLFSPSDARTKELFETLQKYTGQDYFRDARVAKFIMDALGDVRGKSLLEQIPDSPTGIIGKGIELLKNKISDPIDSAKRYIDKR